jgi:protein TonB
MLALLSILVLLLHLWGALWLLSPAELKIIAAKPLMMNVSMISISAPKLSVAPQPPAPPQPIKTPEQIKPQVKPMPKKLPPIVQKLPDTALAEKFVEQRSAPPISTSEASAASTSKAEAATSHAEAFTEANYHANYASNPKPEYPVIAKSRDWQGKVLLRVQVSAAGLTDSVKVEKSSGHEMLDECALEAVKQWRFIPAKRGETAVASSVIVPISFSLND